MIDMRTLVSVAMAFAVGVVCPGAWAQVVEVANPSFEDGDTAPAGWTLSGGQGEGEVSDGHALGVEVLEDLMALGLQVAFADETPLGVEGSLSRDEV